MYELWLIFMKIINVYLSLCYVTHDLDKSAGINWLHGHTRTINLNLKLKHLVC